MSYLKKIVFNSKIAAENASNYDADLDMGGDEASLNKPVRVMYDQDTNHEAIDVDPEREGGATWRAAKNAAKHVLRNYEAQGYSEPPTGHVDEHGVSDRDLMGIYYHKKSGKWKYDPKRSRLSSHRTLADYATLPVVGKAFKNIKNEVGTQTFSDSITNPSLHVGYDTEGRPVAAGEMTDAKGKMSLAEPMKKIGLAHNLREFMLADVPSQGKKGMKDYWEAAKQVAHLTHGRGVTAADPLASEDDSKTKWHGLKAGAEPLKLHKDLNAVINNTANHTDLDERRIPGNKSVVDAFRDMHNDAKTAYFVMDNCPTCVHHHPADVWNTIFDVQHHKRIMDSPDKLIREAYFHPTSFHRGHLDQVGGKLTELGTVAALSPHRITFGTDLTQRFVNHLKNSFQKRDYKRQQESTVPRYRSQSEGIGTELDSGSLPSSENWDDYPAW